MKFWKLALCGAAASLAIAGAAAAQDDSGVSFSYNAGIATDYVFRGISQTDSEQLFGGIDLSADKFYAGAWLSNVDFGDGTDAELDLYVGVKPELGPVTLDLAAIYYGYIGEAKNADYEYAELKAAGSIPVGPATLGIASYYSPEFFGNTGQATYVEGNGAWTINDQWSVGGAVGKQYIENAADYTTWNLGVGWAPIEHVAFDLRYSDSDLDCAIYCGEKVVLTLKTVWP